MEINPNLVRGFRARSSAVAYSVIGTSNPMLLASDSGPRKAALVYSVFGASVKTTKSHSAPTPFLGDRPGAVDGEADKVVPSGDRFSFVVCAPLCSASGGPVRPDSTGSLA